MTCSFDAMFLPRGNKNRISGCQNDLKVRKDQQRAAREQADKLILGLVIPEAVRGTMPLRYHMLDPAIVGTGQQSAEFFFSFLRN